MDSVRHQRTFNRSTSRTWRMTVLTNVRANILLRSWPRPELHLPGGAAQTRIVSVTRIRLDSRKSARPFKGIFCGDVSEFESYMPRQAVGSPPATCECRSKPLGRTSASGRQPGFMRAAAHQGGRDRAMVPDADSRVDAYMCHETIKPVARDKGGVTGCDAFRLRGRPCRIIRNRVMSGRACIA
jgi:hypothetical protein